MEVNTEEKSSRLETMVAILIAIVAMLGAVVAWRSSVVDDGAGDADYAGLRAAVNAEETRALNFVNAYKVARKAISGDVCSIFLCSKRLAQLRIAIANNDFRQALLPRIKQANARRQTRT